MSATLTQFELLTALVLEYRLTEDDIRRYCLAGRPRKCWRTCGRRKVAMALLALLGLFLVGTCYHARGLRPATLAGVTTLGIVGILAWSRQVKIDGHVCRLARQMGLPEDFRLVVSPEGIVEEPGAGSSNPGRSIPWPKVTEIERVDGLTVLRLRPVGCLLFIPDRAFSTPEARDDFVNQSRAWREATPR